MEKFRHEMTLPTLMLWIFAIAFGIACASNENGTGMPKRAELASDVGSALVIASWVLADARKRGRRLCYDYDSLVYFFWPVIVPIYLFQTRGARAFLTLLCFAGLGLVAAIAAGVVFLVREFAF